MALITYPLNNINYTAEDAELFHCTRTSGVWAKNSFPLSATGANNKVTVGKGIAWINNEEFSGKVVALKESRSLDLGVADSTYPRIDVIAIQYNANNNSTDVIIKKGTPATNPVRPAIVRTGAVYELYLASIYREAGATNITASNITDLRMDSTVCGLMADSVTSIDMEAIRSQFMSLVRDLEDAIQDIDVGEVVPVEKGGTNAKTASGARQNINFIGENPSIKNDTPKEWATLGTGVANIADNNFFPTENGILVNAVTGDYISQEWIDIVSGTPTTWKRNGRIGGNWLSGWVVEPKFRLLWGNASPASAFVAQTIDLDLTGYDEIRVEFRNTASSSYYSYGTFVKGKASRHLMFAKHTTNDVDTLIMDRGVTMNVTEVYFSGGSQKTMNGKTYSENNGNLIPVRIWGIKGVQ